MSDTNVRQIKEVEGGMVSVPMQVLQSLIWNAELAIIGMGAGEQAVNDQCAELKRYITAAQPAEVRNAGEGFTLEPFDPLHNVVAVDFGTKV